MFTLCKMAVFRFMMRFEILWARGIGISLAYVGRKIDSLMGEIKSDDLSLNKRLRKTDICIFYLGVHRWLAEYSGIWAEHMMRKHKMYKEFYDRVTI